MQKTTIHRLVEFGQSIWLDYISRSLIDSGKLQEMIELGVMGMTSNPSIFDKAISSTNDYDRLIIELRRDQKTTFQIYDDLTVKDIQDAADAFRPIYERTKGLDGYVSLEINPKLAYETEQTIEEGKRLFEKVDRPNLLLKVPSTQPGFRAIEELLALGININITLIFSLQQYINTAQSYIRGLQKRLAKNRDIHNIASVASVFVSRVDTQVDKLLEEKMKQDPDNLNKDLVALKGKAAVANAANIFREYQQIFSGQEFQEIQKKGGRVQRLLWGSTSTKNPDYSDIKYVAELIGENTINTIPEKTLTAFLDHGIVQKCLTNEISKHKAILDSLHRVGIDVDEVCKKLLDDGVFAFENAFVSLLTAITEKAKKL